MVDDEPLIIELLEDFLKADGFQVSHAAGGFEALDRLRTQCVDGIITDLKMPRGGGLEILKHVNSLATARPALMLATGFFDLSVEDALDLGADAVVKKPFEFSEILRTLRRLLETPAQRWGVPPSPLSSLSPAMNLRREVKSDPWREGSLRFGRGGFATRLDAPMNFSASQMLSFDLNYFDGPAAARLRGAGVLQWAHGRHNPKASADPHQAPPPSIGVEFRWLHPEDTAAFLARHLERQDAAYIPAAATLTDQGGL